MQRLTTEDFIARAKVIHCDRYDYSRAKYVNTRTKVLVICCVPGHPPFEITPQDHLQGRGCAHCAKRKKVTTDIFIEDAKKVHGERYDYSLVDYKSNKREVDIICRVPGHPVFSLRPDAHLHQKQGCPVCGGTQKLTADSFVILAKSVHGNRYDYSQVKYVNNKTDVVVVCPDHGPFSQSPNSHLNGRGCADCGGRKKLTGEQFVERAKAIHGDQYDYSEVAYVNIETKVKIICPEHSLFEQAPLHHLHQQSGCPDCAESGFNPSEPGLLYYVAIATDDGDTRYKIGITNHTIERRFSAEDLNRLRIVKTWRYAIGRVAAEREAQILSQYAGDKYSGPVILKSGNTELFTHDILGLDK